MEGENTRPKSRQSITQGDIDRLLLRQTSGVSRRRNSATLFRKAKASTPGEMKRRSWVRALSGRLSSSGRSERSDSRSSLNPRFGVEVDESVSGNDSSSEALSSDHESIVMTPVEQEYEARQGENQCSSRHHCVIEESAALDHRNLSEGTFNEGTAVDSTFEDTSSNGEDQPTSTEPNQLNHDTMTRKNTGGHETATRKHLEGQRVSTRVQSSNNSLRRNSSVATINKEGSSETSNRHEDEMHSNADESHGSLLNGNSEQCIRCPNDSSHILHLQTMPQTKCSMCEQSFHIMFGCNLCRILFCLPHCYQVFYPISDLAKLTPEILMNWWQSIARPEPEPLFIIRTEHDVRRIMIYLFLFSPHAFDTCFQWLLERAASDEGPVVELEQPVAGVRSDRDLVRGIFKYCSALASMSNARTVQKVLDIQTDMPFIQGSDLAAAAMRAAMRGNCQQLERLLRDPRFTNQLKESVDVLRFAASEGHLDAVQLLVAQGFKVEWHSNSAALAASFQGRLNVLEYLLSFPEVDVSETDNYAIKWAAYHGHYDVVKRLLRDPKCSPNAQSNYAIAMAAFRGHLPIVKLLLRDDRVDPSDDNDAAVRFASFSGQIEILNLLLLDKRVNPGSRDNYAFNWAVYNGHLLVVERLLLDPRVNPSMVENTAIRCAAEQNHLSILNVLLKEPRVDPTADYQCALVAASMKGHLRIVKRLLEDPRIDPTARKSNFYALGLASRYGHLDVVNRLLQDPRVDPAVYQNCPLGCAATWGQANVVERLLQDDRVDPSDQKCHSLRRAVAGGHVEVCELLLADSRVDPSVERNFAIRVSSANAFLAAMNHGNKEFNLPITDTWRPHFQTHVQQLDGANLEPGEDSLRAAVEKEPNLLRDVSLTSMDNTHYKIALRLLKEPKVSKNLAFLADIETHEWVAVRELIHHSTLRSAREGAQFMLQCAERARLFIPPEVVFEIVNVFCPVRR